MRQLDTRVLYPLLAITLGLAGCGKDKTDKSTAKDDVPGGSDSADDGAEGDDALSAADAPEPPGADTSEVPAAFPTIASTPGRAEYQFEHDGELRSFLVYIPKSAGASAPMMLVLHGGGGSALQMFEQHGLEARGDTAGFLMVAPQGTLKAGETGDYDWNGQVLLDNGTDDVGFLERIILGLTEQLGADPKRRYLSGFSGGASMTIRFGAEKPALVTAIGTFAGKVGLSKAGAPFVFPPTPSSPLNVQITYGTKDDNLEGELKEDEDVQATSGRAGIEWWASALSCGMTPVTEVVGELTTDTYSGCSGGTVVRMVTVKGMKHTWPDLKDNGLDGTQFLIDFFSDKVSP